MPNDTINRAVKRGTGELEGVAYEEILYEGTGPSGTLYLVEGLTDNRNRTVAEVRKIFERNNGALGGAGSAGWAFDRKGTLQISKSAVSEDELMEVAVGAGADDYTDNGDEWFVTTPANALDAVVKALEAGKFAIKASATAFIAKNKKHVTGRDAEVCLNLAEALDDHDDVQNVYSDFDISDEQAAKMSAE
jgi:YebC/PmpR family DNA-binding regulatory protein